eukprot:2173250-Rhodomonas_salina.3
MIERASHVAQTHGSERMRERQKGKSNRRPWWARSGGKNGRWRTGLTPQPSSASDRAPHRRSARGWGHLVIRVDDPDADSELRAPHAASVPLVAHNCQYNTNKELKRNHRLNSSWTRLP